MPAAPPRGDKRAAGGVRGALARVQGLNAAFLQASRAQADAALAASTPGPLPRRAPASSSSPTPSPSFSSEQEARERRARRFALDRVEGGSAGGSSSDPSPEPALFSLPLDAPPLVGTCARVRKPYFRLTSAPRPDEVRPPAVLREALADAKRLWVEKREYGEARDAFRSIRQDAVLQGAARGIDVGANDARSAQGARTPPSIAFRLAVLEVAAEAYGAHARLTLEVGDWRELRRCVEPLLGVLERLAEYAAEREARAKRKKTGGEGENGDGGAERPRTEEARRTGERGGSGELGGSAGKRMVEQRMRDGKKRRAASGGRAIAPPPSSDSDSPLPAPSHPWEHYLDVALEFAAYDLAVAAASGADAWYDAERRADRIVASAERQRGAVYAAPAFPPPSSSSGLATLRHARRACRAFFARETVAFARLHAEAPRMLPYALDPLAEALKELSYAAVVAAYRPSLDGRALASALGVRKRRRALAYARERGGRVEGDLLVLSNR